MRILRSVVSPSFVAMLMRDPKITRRCVVGPHIVGDQTLWQDAIISIGSGYLLEDLNWVYSSSFLFGDV